jgi:hypothetical protein
MGTEGKLVNYSDYRSHAAILRRSDIEVEKYTIDIQAPTKNGIIDISQGYSVKCLFSIQNYRVKATFYRVSQGNLMKLVLLVSWCHGRP